MDLFEEDRRFKSKQEYELWRESLRSSDCVTFVSSRGKRIYDEYTAETLYCSRSSTTKRIQKAPTDQPSRSTIRISLKCDLVCAAYLHVSAIESRLQ